MSGYVRLDERGAGFMGCNWGGALGSTIILILDIRGSASKKRSQAILTFTVQPHLSCCFLPTIPRGHIFLS